MVAVVPQHALELIPELLGDRSAAGVACIRPDLDPPGFQLLEREGSDRLHRLGHVALPGVRGAHPIADLEGRNAPIDAVEAAAADDAVPPEQQQL